MAADAPGRPGVIEDYAQLVEALIARREALSPRLGVFAQFCLNRPEDVALYNIVTLARMAGVAPATITRFAQELGFAGFGDLQTIFRQRLIGPGGPMRRPGDAGGPGGAGHAPDLESPGGALHSFVRAGVDSLLRLDDEIDHGALETFVEALAAKGAVHVAAARGAFGIGAYCVYGLANVGKRAHLLDNLGAMRVEQLAAMAPDDALLVLTFDDYTPETVEIARIAAAGGHAVLAVTDNELSPVAGLARAALFVREARLGHFRSQVPALVLCQALIVSLGRRLERSR